MKSITIWVLAFAFSAGSVLAQQASPVIRGVFAQTRPGGDPLTRARLGAYLGVVVCKSEYKPSSDLFLYLDGRKSTPAGQPLVLEDNRSEGDSKAAREACLHASTPAQEDEDKAKAAEAAAAAAAEALSKSPNDAVLKKDADEKKAAAETARAKADATKKAVGETEALTYYLDPQLLTAKDTKDSWLELLQTPWEKGDVAVSVGPAAGPWPGTAAIPFQRLNYWWLAGWAALFIVAVVRFVKFARTSDVIRDFGTLPPGTPPGTQKAYSLGRTQMALWTFLVGAALAFIFLVTWNENTLTPGVLVLMGISSGTTVLAAVAEGTPAPQPTKGFFNDLVTDGTGASFHRYQMILFTVILAVIFTVKVVNGLTMPEFDSTLLGLMGISNGTYLGFKLQGK